jgi:4-hydroxy-3-methylbut-2-enyl diphosphate reductase
MLGMIVHNSRVINDLLEKGIVFLKEEDLLENKVKLCSDDLVIVRAHGSLKKVYEILEEEHAIVSDAACIFVKRARDLLIEKEKEGYKIIFIGDKNHPEVKGIVSHGDIVAVYKDLEELKEQNIDLNAKYFFLAQTTLNMKTYNKIKEFVAENLKNSSVGHTICGATYERQKAVEKLAHENEIVLVIGGKNSSNTKKLYLISKKINEKTYWIESKEEIDFNWFEGIKKVGITAGASTPEESIQEIENSIKGEQYNVRF